MSLEGQYLGESQDEVVALLVAQDAPFLLLLDGIHLGLRQLAGLDQIRRCCIEQFFEFFLSNDVFQNAVVNASERV